MISKNLLNKYPVESTDIVNTVLQGHSNNWYKIELGHFFDPETGDVSETVLYHVVNRITDVVEYQGHHLPTAISMAKNLGTAMDELVGEDANQPEYMN